jgi:hypothetical protein
VVEGHRLAHAHQAPKCRRASTITLNAGRFCRRLG